MKKRFFLITILLTIFAVCTSGNRTATAYTIDGLVDDWGIDLSLAISAGDLDTKPNPPSGGWNIDYITEDNADSAAEWTEVGPLWSFRNYFDAEAMYFDNDQYYAYIAIIQGLPIGGINPPGNAVGEDDNHAFKPGDIFIDVDDDDIYEYGLNISDRRLYKNPTCPTCEEEYYKKVYYNGGSEANPWKINEDELLDWKDEGKVDFVYSSEEQYTHYVLEAAIPLSYLGLSADPSSSVQNIGIHWTQECGNDYLNLDADINPVPEPATMLLLGARGSLAWHASEGRSLEEGRQSNSWDSKIQHGS